MRTVHRAISVLSVVILMTGPSAIVAAQSDAPPVPGATSGRGASQAPLDTSTWTTYVSDRYGFSIDHPAGWTERPADHTWTLAADTDWLSSATEQFHGPELLVSAWSLPVEPGTTAEAWLQAYCPSLHATCTGLEDQTVTVTLDGHPGSLVRYAEDTQAFILVDDRIYVVAAWQPESDASAAPYGGATRLLEGFLSTMHLLPGGPGASSSAIASPAL